jgi:hypothetical protein
MSCPYIKNFIALILGVIYLPLAMLGNGQLTLCLTEKGEMQFEHGIGACDVDPIHAGSLAMENSCGNCTDTQFKASETLRINNNVNVAPIQNVFLCWVTDQKTVPVQAYIEPESSAPDLVGSSILII